MFGIISLSLAVVLQVEVACWEEGAQLRLNGEFSAAEVLLDRCLADEPDNADALVQLGLARLPQGDRAGAESAFERALLLAPDYLDASIGLARIAYFERDYGRALFLLDGLGASTPESRTLREDVVAAREAARGADTQPWRIDLAYGRSGLTQGLPDWTEFSVALSYNLNDTQILTGRIASAERFENSDVLGEVRLTQSLSAGRGGLCGA
ncbi:tetratricopeptide repeat protein [Maricaulaceae bacterium EIL42A08]|nr:tetratricopeptide repeat protein [Maricaulaceae bacterium EIL42A08]